MKNNLLFFFLISISFCFSQKARGQVGIAYGWNINSTNDSWYFATGISSTGGGNYAEISNGSPFPNPGT